MLCPPLLPELSASVRGAFVFLQKAMVEFARRFDLFVKAEFSVSTLSSFWSN
jgi:hypothetical protein